MKLIDQNFSKCLLIATPAVTDPYFQESVVYIHDHSMNGAVGIIINKRLKINFNDLLYYLDIKSKQRSVYKNQSLLLGGPIAQDNCLIIYQNNIIPSTEILISTSKDMLEDLTKGKGPNDFLITLGYAGWQANQLEQEIAENSWLPVPAHSNVLFHVPLEERRKAAGALIGFDIHNLSEQTGHA